MNYCKTYENPKIHAITGETIRPGGFTLTERAMEYCGFSPGAKILDVGCGLGATVEYLVDRFGLDALGIDPSPLLLERRQGLRPDLQLMEGRAECLPLEAGVMDGVICECSFSLLEDQGKALQEFQRVMKDKGRLIITDMYVRNPPKAQGLRHRGIKNCLTGAKPVPEFIKLLQAGGFDLILWEDHTRCLAELTARLILSGFPLEEFFPCSSCNPRGAGVKADIKAAKVGYFLLIARKSVKGADYHE
jgi:arsenite methyltransferase